MTKSRWALVHRFTRIDARRERHRLGSNHRKIEESIATSLRFDGLGVLAVLVLLSAVLSCGGGRVVLPPSDGAADAHGTETSGSGIGDSTVASADDGGRDDANDAAPPTTGTIDAGPASCITAVRLRTQTVDKVDILFMIDNSLSMGDKQALLADAVPDMINRLVSPNCVDATGSVLAPSSNAQCANGQLEFAPVHDMHIGIVTSSLGGRGASKTCNPADPNPANPTVNAHNDDQGRLINRQLVGGVEIPVPNAGSPLNFLAWYPSVPANTNSMSNPPPPVPAETVVGDRMTAGTLIGDFTAMLQGVQEHGCGFEAQNEAWYRFLVQPDPFQSIATSTGKASLNGVDSVILQQRKNFLRPDSLLAVVVVTDENEEVANPLSVGGQGWLFEGPWPSSPTQGAPEGTAECLANPLDPNCTSCAFSAVTSLTQSAYHVRCPPDPPQTADGYLDPNDDSINVRFFHQKQRFGVFAGYSISRYIRGLTRLSVPDRTNEVDSTGNYVGDQDSHANCVNPIFAQNLPTSPTADLCHLTPGPRTSDLVYYAAIAGVPHQLLQAQVGIDPECPMGTNQADCPQKNVLTDADWLKITGKDPENYDFTGADFHMLESELPRAQSPCTPNSADTCDPINGREWNTNKGDLQFACTFQLPAPKDCTLPQYLGACDCADTVFGPFNQSAKPLCDKTGGNYTAIQSRGKAYPSIREMAIAHEMANHSSGIQGIVSSLCPIHTHAASLVDPVFGYRPAVTAIVSRLKTALGAQCLPPNICLNSALVQQCILWILLPKPGGEDQCNGIPGLSIPPANLLQQFQQSQHQQWLTTRSAMMGLTDPSTLPACLLRELTPQQNPAAFGTDDTCLASSEAGWCNVPGKANGCTQEVLFTANVPPPGAVPILQCFR